MVGSKTSGSGSWLCQHEENEDLAKMVGLELVMIWVEFGFHVLTITQGCPTSFTTQKRFVLRCFFKGLINIGFQKGCSMVAAK